MPTAPFIDSSLTEVVSRVAFRMLEREYIKHRADNPSLQVCTNRLIRDLPTGHFRDLVLALAGMQWSCSLSKIRAVEWRDRAIKAARLGMPFRAVYYTEYKAHRRR